MSWSVCFIGKPANVVAALKAQSDKISGQCKVEYDDALPHLVGLAEQNFAVEGSGHSEPMLRVEASGSGCARSSSSGPTVQTQRSCSVKVEVFYGNLV